MHPRHLSLYEKEVLGLHHQYNPELDAEAKQAEARQTASERLQVCGPASVFFVMNGTVVSLNQSYLV